VYANQINSRLLGNIRLKIFKIYLNQGEIDIIINSFATDDINESNTNDLIDMIDHFA
jgi:hypothetical protein